ncbi:hypothetical protein C8R47DRAFT_1225525 [Mycena vitilis]|nr:hypothetical protein C8R47DRAFT_1225525 [Mycena vitilis]
MNPALLPYTKPPLDFDPNDTRAIYNSLCKARQSATNKPLQCGSQFSLALDIPRQNSAPGARGVPFLGTNGTTAESGTAKVSLALREVLQPGIGGFSQVWRAVPLGAPDTSLVMKIIQPSLCYFPLPDEDWLGDNHRPQHLAEHEAWVYKAFASKQGSLIPYFFGLHTIETPSKEWAWVLVFEFIPGHTLAAAAEQKSIPVIQEFCTLGIESVKEMALSHWELADMQNPANFILTGTGETRRVVLIDLFGGLPWTAPDLRPLLRRDIRRFYQTLCDAVPWRPRSEMDKWAIEHLQPYPYLTVPLHKLPDYPLSTEI